MTAPRPTSPAPPPPRPSLEVLPPLPSWRPLAQALAPPLRRASDAPTDDLRAALLDPPDGDPLPEEIPTQDLGIPRGSSPAPPAPAEPAEPEERRRSRRHRLVGTAVRANIKDPTGAIEPTRGRVRDISAAGGLFVETRAPFPEHTVVRVSMAVSAQAVRLTGAVVRASDEGMAVQLRVDDAALAFLNVFVAVAREAKHSNALEIHVDRALGDHAAADEVLLENAYLELRRVPADPEAHRRLLDLAVSLRRTDYALERLRELKAERADVPEIDRSLEHLGRVLGFVALSRPPKIAERRARLRPLVVAALIVLASVLALGGLAQRARAPREPPPISH